MSDETQPPALPGEVWRGQGSRSEWLVVEVLHGHYRPVVREWNGEAWVYCSHEGMRVAALTEWALSLLTRAQKAEQIVETMRYWCAEYPHSHAAKTFRRALGEEP